MEGLKHLYPFCSNEYLMKIHFLAFRSSFDLFSSRTYTYVMQPNTLRCETSGFLTYEFFFGCHAMNCCGYSIHDIDCNCYRFSLKVIWQILFIQHSTCYFWNMHVFPFSNSILLWGIWRTPTLLERLKCKSKSGNNKRKKS